MDTKSATVDGGPSRNSPQGLTNVKDSTMARTRNATTDFKGGSKAMNISSPGGQSNGKSTFNRPTKFAKTGKDIIGLEQTSKSTLL